MNPMMQGILGSLVRLALGGVITWLMQRGILDEGQVEYLVSGLVLGLGTVGWAVMRRYWDRQKLVTALALPATSEHHVEDAIKDGLAASVTTSPAVRPQMGTGA